MSCLFNSIQSFLPLGPQEIRNQICDYLAENRPIIDGMETRVILAMDRPNYVARMRRPSTWGGAIEIQAACNIWAMSVVVHDIRHSRGGVIQFLPVNGENNREIHLSWSGGHYTPMSSVQFGQ